MQILQPKPTTNLVPKIRANTRYGHGPKKGCIRIEKSKQKENTSLFKT
ncbi:10612_t:CDS:2 [Gigaspora margarita]|uniref:10612_t:CDS:1 n=1 Tax=Gigaspora margarita TaxID=4874 RepID=A0ABM8W5J9_GIGMA|nr:10612_t:CDS:2 [Gigaspora margarita]